MPSPTSTLYTLRPDLASSVQAFDLEANRAGYIGRRLMPMITVGVQSGRFGKIPLKQLLQTASTNRASGSAYSRGSWTFEPASFATEEHGWEEPLDDRDVAMYEEYFDAELIATARARNFVLQNEEIRVVDMLQNATTFASQITSVTHEWNDHTNAVPIANVEAACKAVWDRTGVWPNAIAMNNRQFRNLRLCDQIRDRISSNGAGGSELAGRITEQQIAEALDLQYVLVHGKAGMGGAKNTANEGQDASISPIWSNEYVGVGRIAETEDPREPCVGRIFHWPGDGAARDCAIETYRDETVRSDIVRARNDTDELFIFSEMWQLLDNIIDGTLAT